jgi:hypothetical protein
MLLLLAPEVLKFGKEVKGRMPGYAEEDAEDAAVFKFVGLMVVDGNSSKIRSVLYSPEQEKIN